MHRDEDQPAATVTEGQALANVVRILGPVKILGRGDSETIRAATLLDTRRASIRWLKETAEFIDCPSRPRFW